MLNDLINFATSKIVKISSQSTRTGKNATHHWALKLPLCTLSGKLRTFPMVKLKTIGFLPDRTQQYTPVLFGETPHELLPEKEKDLLSGHYATYFEVAGMFYTTRCM